MNQLVVFLDIDNTLYSGEEYHSLAEQIRDGLVEYVGNWLQLTPQESEAYVVHCFEKYGLTIAGLMHEQKGFDAEAATDFLYSHCDFSHLQENPRLREMLSRLRRNHHLYFFTNASRRHATKVLQALGLSSDEFPMSGFTYEDQWAQTAPVPCNKPMRNAYIAVIKVVKKWLQDAEWVTAECMVMVDDSACNLIEPLALGLNAVWVSHGHPIPDVLAEKKNTGRLFCITDIIELEDIIKQITINREN
ncbi:hypothetical protein C3747_114g30 [Trypanosoma cruzi]|uniref:Haloacid dehalogenase-like hydrolase n=1 Tax=Trypanosoma cruzi TaxID=5693 RepID=A0A2V2WE12_TRYCR|nr:hypothetical protein C3747_114g30 [Trypanosoma cruzi]